MYETCLLVRQSHTKICVIIFNFWEFLAFFDRNMYVQPNLSASWLFQKAMSAKQQPDVSPSFINELLHANFQSMEVKLA